MPPFVSPLNFLDPEFNENGEPYGPQRFRDITYEKYLISKYTHNSFEDINVMTPLERSYIIEFITQELEYQKEQIENAKKGVNNG